MNLVGPDSFGQIPHWDLEPDKLETSWERAPPLQQQEPWQPQQLTLLEPSEEEHQEQWQEQWQLWQWTLESPELQSAWWSPGDSGWRGA
jgi:hypothetical protein